MDTLNIKNKEMLEKVFKEFNIEVTSEFENDLKSLAVKLQTLKETHPEEYLQKLQESLLELDEVNTALDTFEAEIFKVKQ